MPTDLMLATHNQKSIKTAIAVMNGYGINRRDPCTCFGQLLGMSDKLSFGLRRNEHRASEPWNVPEGEVKMAMTAFLVTANDNSSLAGGAAQELTMIQSELLEDLFCDPN